jgi:hypothetical protein
MALRALRKGREFDLGDHHVEVLPQLDQAVHEQFGVLEVDVVVPGPVHQQQASAKGLREIDRGAAPVTLGVLLREAHIPFLIDRVVEALVRAGGRRHTNLVEVREPEERVQGGRPAPAVTVDANAIQIDPRTRGCECSECLSLIS